MTNFDHLKDIWNQQEKPKMPDVSEIMSKARLERSSMNKKIILQVATLLLSIVAIVWVYLTIDFKMLTTSVGIAIMLFTILAFSVIRLYQVYRLKVIDITGAPQKVLLQLESFYSFQQFVNTKCTFIYFVLLNVALGLYFIEVMKPMSTTLKVVVLIIYVSWMLVAYLIIGKRQKAKEYAKTESIINLIRQMEKDFQ